MRFQNSMLAVLFMAMSSIAIAMENNTNTGGHWNWGGSVELLNLDGERAEQEFVSSSATAFGVYADYLNQNWVTSLRGSFIFYSDEAEFSQLVEYEGGFNDDEIEEVSSDATALSFGVATGRQWRFGEQLNTRALLQVGYDHIFASERSITNCSDCYSDDIDIKGGVFVQGAIRHNFGGFSMGLALAQYLTGDGLSNRVGVTVGTDF